MTAVAPQALPTFGRTAVVGVLNVTPDSFSDGGLFASDEQAIEHGITLHRQGADIVDVGGESTRPGAERISAEVECSRVVPVVEALVSAGVPVSIDTMRAQTAEAAVAAGACIGNDVSGGLADDDMLAAISALKVPCILMHWRGHSRDMNSRAVYSDVVREVRDELALRVGAALDAGIAAERIVVDPGLGFAKEAEHNWLLLRGIPELQALGMPILIGASRKRFLGALLADDAGEPRAVAQRDAATDAITAIASSMGAWGVRVHDVRGSSDAVRVARAWTTAGLDEGQLP